MSGPSPHPWSVDVLAQASRLPSQPLDARLAQGLSVASLPDQHSATPQVGGTLSGTSFASLLPACISRSCSDASCSVLSVHVVQEFADLGLLMHGEWPAAVGVHVPLDSCPPGGFTFVCPWMARSAAAVLPPGSGAQGLQVLQMPLGYRAAGLCAGFAPKSKQRLRWTPELHQRFLAACNLLGGPERATPKQILLQMDVTGGWWC